MRLLYGVVGEGMGHATRSRVVLEHLLAAGHIVRVVVSGRAHDFLKQLYAERPEITIEEIHGLTLEYEENAVDRSESLLTNLADAPEGLLKNIAVYRRVAEQGFAPEAVISDFESWAFLYGLNHRLPIISIDNMQVINRCQHSTDVTDDRSFDFHLAKLAVKIKLPGAYHYLVSSFFFPPVRKERTTLIPPILRPEILAARREPGDHVLVYQRAVGGDELVEILGSLPYQFCVYGVDSAGRRGNVELKPFSQQGFVDDLRTARAVVAGGGYSLMGEAVHLHVPMLAVPIEKQYEQELNSRYLRKLGYGDWTRELETATVADFLSRADDYAHALESYPSHDNEMLFGCVDRLLHFAGIDEPAPLRLDAPSMGTYDGPLLPEENAGLVVIPDT